jgi:hypothetical protein
MNTAQYYDRVYLQPPSMSLKKEKLLTQLDKWQNKKKALENLPTEWTSEQEREYDNILDEIRFLEVEIEVTL